MAVSATTLAMGSNTANASAYTTASVAGATNTLVLLAFQNHGATQRSVSSVVGGGASAGWTSVKSINYNVVATPLDEVDVWRYLSSSPAAASVITVTLSGSASNGQWVVAQFSGVSTAGTNGANAVVQSVSSQADAVSILTCILASFTSTVNVPYGAISFSTTVLGTINPGSNFKELGEANATEHSGIESEWSSVITTKVDAALTAGTRSAGGIALEIAGDNPAVAATAFPYYYSGYYSRTVMGIA